MVAEDLSDWWGREGDGEGNGLVVGGSGISGDGWLWKKSSFEGVKS